MDNMFQKNVDNPLQIAAEESIKRNTTSIYGAVHDNIKQAVNCHAADNAIR